MKQLLFLFLLLITTLGNGQSLKSYSGTYENGTASYQYYENENYERILHGTFTYKEKEYSIVGQFKNNLRSGLWKATTINKNYATNSTITEVSTGNYVDGNLDGECKYIKTDDATKKILSKSTARFKSNIPVGDYFFSVNDNENNFTVHCYLDNEGFADSTLTVKYIYSGKQYEDIRKFRNGFLYWQLHRDMTTGHIIKKIDKKSLVDEIFTNYDSVNKFSIITYVEFSNSDAPPYYTSYFKSEKKGRRSHELAKTKNKNIFYYENAPFTYVKGTFGMDYDSFWDLYKGINFWQNTGCSDCGSNPLFRLSKGAHPNSFLPVKNLALRDDLYSITVKQREILERQKRRRLLLDSLKSVILSTIEWRKIGNDSSSNALTLSRKPISYSQIESLEVYSHFEKNYYNSDYATNYVVRDHNERIEKAIEHVYWSIKSTTLTSNQPYKGKLREEEIELLLKMIGLRLVTEKEIITALRREAKEDSSLSGTISIYYIGK